MIRKAMFGTGSGFYLMLQAEPHPSRFTGVGQTTAGGSVQEIPIEAIKSETKPAGTALRRSTRAPKITKQVKRFEGRGISADGATDREFKARRAPKRQFSKKRDPPRKPVFSPFVGVGRPLRAPSSGPTSSRGRALRKPKPFDLQAAPLQNTPIVCIKRRNRDGTVRVEADLTEDQIYAAGAARQLHAFNRCVRKM